MTMAVAAAVAGVHVSCASGDGPARFSCTPTGSRGDDE